MNQTRNELPLILPTTPAPSPKKKSPTRNASRLPDPWGSASPGPVGGHADEHNQGEEDHLEDEPDDLKREPERDDQRDERDREIHAWAVHAAYVSEAAAPAKRCSIGQARRCGRA